MRGLLIIIWRKCIANYDGFLFVCCHVTVEIGHELRSDSVGDVLLICHMILLLILLTYFFRLFTLTRAISGMYSFVLTPKCNFDLRVISVYSMFLNRFVSFRRLINFLIHYRLLCEFDRL